jgi:excisionase family DNA binding protein
LFIVPGKSNPKFIKPKPAVVRRYVKIDDAAEYIDVHPVTIRKMITSGRIHGYRSGTRLLRVDLNELDAFLEDGK